MCSKVGQGVEMQPRLGRATGFPVASPSVPWTVRDVWLGTLLVFLIQGADLGSWYALRALSLRPSLDVWDGVGTVVFYVLIAVVAWWFSVRKHQAPLRAFGLARFEGNVIWIGVGLLFLAGIFEAIYAHVLASYGIQMQPDLSPVLSQLSSPWLVVFGTVIVGPAVEEIFFRGFLFGGLRSRYSWRIAAIISSALFAALHLQPAAFLPLFVFGYILTYLYQRSNSIWPGMIIHMANNGLFILASFAALGPR
jgi:uncharacterized protein